MESQQQMKQETGVKKQHCKANTMSILDLFNCHITQHYLITVYLVHPFLAFHLEKSRKSKLWF